MFPKTKKLLLFSLALLLLIIMPNIAFAESASEKSCAIYFTKIGCPVCSKTDPVVLTQWPVKYKDFVVIEYVFRSWSGENSELLWEYATKFGFSSSVPTIVFEEEHATGLPPVFDIESRILNVGKKCRFLDGLKGFEEINLNELPAKPKVWANGRVLIRLENGGVSSDFLKEVLFTENLEEVLKNSKYEVVEIAAEPEAISHGQINFKKAFKIGKGWVLKCSDDISLSSSGNENSTPVIVLPPDNNGTGNNNGGNNEENNGNYFYIVLTISIIIVVVLVLLLSSFIILKIKKQGA